MAVPPEPPIELLSSLEDNLRRFIEEIGYYNPMTEPKDIKLDAELAKKWLANGAQPTDTVKALFVKSGIIEK